MLMNIPAGTVIIKEGESNMDMYKIVYGNVELYSGYGTKNETILGIKSKNDYFGEMGLFSGGKPAIYTVVAYSDVVVSRITQADVDAFIQTNHVDVYKIMQHMAESMYSMKFSMDLYIDDIINANNDSQANIKEFKVFFTKQFAKYNATKMIHQNNPSTINIKL